MRDLVKVLLAVLVLLLQASQGLPAEEKGTWSIDDFEDGDLKAAPGLSWFLIADDLTGGASQARLDVRPGGPEDSKHALRLSGRLDGSPGWPFAGAWANLDRMGRSVNLDAFEGIRLRVKGPARLQVGLRAGGNNFMAEVDAGSGWKLVDVPFSSLVAQGKAAEGTRWSSEAVQVFGITTPQATRGTEHAPAKVDFEVDDVVLYGGGPAPRPVPSGTTGPISTIPFTSLASIPSSGWVELATDPERDGKMPMLPDATRLETIPASADGILWLRVSLRERPHDRWLGMNLAFDTDGDPADGRPWWGANKEFKFDQIVTIWCFHVAEGCEGYIGLADSGQAAAGDYTSQGGGEFRVAIDPQRRAYIVGIPRTSLHLEKEEFRLVAAVGSALLFADDVPGEGAVVLH